MSLGDLAGGGKGRKAPAVAIAIGPGPDTKTAASRLLKAVHANDVEGVEDALHMFYAACDDDSGDKGEG